MVHRMFYIRCMDTAITSSNLPNNRQSRGLIIARDFAKKFRRIADCTIFVPSQTASGKSGYVVQLDGNDGEVATCGCADFEARAGAPTDGCLALVTTPCKHIFAARFHLHLLEMPDGSNVVMAEVTRPKRPTYPQSDWSAYNRAQTVEQDCVRILLSSLCGGIETPQQKTGRPRMPLRDIVYGFATKVYGTKSGRRSMCDIRACAAAGLMTKIPAYNTLSKYAAERPELTPLLSRLVTESARPLIPVERAFAIDASGIAAPRYVRWIDHKYGEDETVARKDWLKLHAVYAVNSGVITSAAVTEATGKGTSDTVMFEALMKRTAAAGFVIEDVLADKGYLSRKNVALVSKLRKEGAALPRAFIPMKTNSTPDGPPEWEKLYYLYALNRDAFKAKYGKRQRSEAGFSSVKRVFMDNVRSKTHAAMVNEILAKCLVSNLTMIVHSAGELGIEPKFWMPGAEAES